MSVAIKGDMAKKVDKSAYDSIFKAILPGSDDLGPAEMGHDRTATASCYLPCHTASRHLPCCDTTS